MAGEIDPRIKPRFPSLGWLPGEAELKTRGQGALDFLRAIDPISGLHRGMYQSGRAFDPSLSSGERKAAGIEALLETAFAAAPVVGARFAGQPLKAALMEMLLPTGAPESMFREPGAVRISGEVPADEIFDVDFERLDDELADGVPGPEVRRPLVSLDNPGGDWLARARATADERMASSDPSTLSGKGLTNAVTAYTGDSVFLPIDELRRLAGAMDEAPAAGQPKFDALMESVRAEGFRNDSPILIGINHLGEPYILEGNNRVAVAAATGVDRIPARVQWYNGGEESASEWSPAAVERMVAGFEVPGVPTPLNEDLDWIHDLDWAPEPGDLVDLGDQPVPDDQQALIDALSPERAPWTSSVWEPAELVSTVGRAARGLEQPSYGSYDEVLANLRRLGAKNRELEMSGIRSLQDVRGPITQDMVSAAVSGDAPLDIIRYGYGPGSDKFPQYEEWFTPGGSNYREVVIKTPGGFGDLYVTPQHFEGAGSGQLVHYRAAEFETPDGLSAYHVGEIQSDVAQRSRRLDRDIEISNYTPERAMEVVEQNKRLYQAEHDAMARVKALSDEIDAMVQDDSVSMSALAAKMRERDLAVAAQEQAMEAVRDFSGTMNTLETYFVFETEPTPRTIAIDERIDDLTRDITFFDEDLRWREAELRTEFAQNAVGNGREQLSWREFVDQDPAMISYREGAANAGAERDALKSELWQLENELPLVAKRTAYRAPTNPHADNPLVKTNAVTDLALRQALADAVQSGSDYVTFGTGDMAFSMTGGSREGQRAYYDGILPRRVNEMLRKLSKEYGIEPPTVEQLEIFGEAESDAYEVPGFRITPELRQAIETLGVDMFREGGLVRSHSWQRSLLESLSE